MGKYMELNFGITKTINDMVHLGLKKSDMIKIMRDEYLKTHPSLDGFDYRKNSFLRSAKSIDVMRQAQKTFVSWASQHGIKKFELVTRDNLCQYLLDRSQQTDSAWSISRDLHFVNKIFGQYITKRELCLPSRLQKNVVRGRGNNGTPKNRPLLLEKNRAQIDMVKATGMRRSSVTRITYKDFSFTPDGCPISLRLIEKGGKLRETYILPSYQDRLKAIIEPFKDRLEPIFNSYDKNINSHFYRHEYACDLLKQLQKEYDSGQPYFGGDFSVEGRITQKERLMYPNGFREYDLEPCSLLSQCLGHNRIDILKSYIF